MKRFHFRLEGLLRVRKRAEETKLRVLQARRAELVQLESELAAIAADRSEQARSIASLVQGTLDAQQLLARRRYINVLNRQSVEKAQERVQLDGKIRVAREELRMAMTARESVEKLRERRYEEYQHDIARADMKELDEFAQAAFHMRRGEQEAGI